MEQIAIFMFGAMFGIICTIIPKCFPGKTDKPEAPEVKEPDEQQKKLQKQWEDFFSYTGDGTGGLVDDE